MSVWDAIVVGAGPAGAVAALGLAREGASVLLVDREPFPRWKVCGACVGPAAVAHLRSIGLEDLLARRDAVPLTHLRLSCAGREARVPLRGNVALSRSVLDQALVDAAVGAGVAFRDGTSATVERSGQDRVELSLRSDGARRAAWARVVIDATGLAGLLVPRAETDRGEGDVEGAMPVRTRSRVASSSRIGVGVELAAGALPLATGELRMVVGRNGYVGLVRTEAGALNVAAAVDREALRAGPAAAVDLILLEAGLPTLPEGSGSRWRGTPPLTHRPVARASTRLFRLGDAAGYVEPFTGEGIGWALASGGAVVRVALAAIAGWRGELVAEWERTYGREVARQQRVCRVLSRALRHPLLVRTAVMALGRRPALADPLVLATSRPARP